MARMSIANQTLENEPLISFASAAALPILSRDGRKPPVGKLFRWSTKGIAIGGRQIYLESVRVGGRRLTTAEAVSRFVEASDCKTVSAAKVGRRDQVAAAEASCAKAGW